jgi:hypothetical protein
MTGDSATDDTLWYDTVLNKIIEDNERTQLAASLQEGAETPSQTSGIAPGEGTA